MREPRPMGNIGWHSIRADWPPHDPPVKTPDAMIWEFDIDDIAVPEEMRAGDEATVADIMELIKDIGLQPSGIPTIQWATSDCAQRAILVVGRQRLEAFRRLGWKTVPAAVFEGSAAEAERWRICENLCRKELTILERADAIAKLKHLRAEVAQVGPRKPDPGGVRALAEETGFGRGTVQRALRIAGLANEAKEEAMRLGLGDNQSSLFEAARKGGAKAQVELLQAAARAFDRQQKPVATASIPAPRSRPLYEPPPKIEPRQQMSLAEAIERCRSLADLIQHLPEMAEVIDAIDKVSKRVTQVKGRPTLH